MHFRGLVHVVQNSDDSKNGRGIDAFAERLVVEADVAAGDGDFQLFAGFSDSINGLRKLPHDVGLLGIAKVQAIGRAHGSGARTRHLARRLGDRVHRAQPRIQIAPPPVAIQCHRQPALRTFNPDHAPIARPRPFDRVGLHHVVILLPHPALAADVRASQQLLESSCELAGGAEFDMLGHLARHRGFPSRQRTLVYGGLVGQRRIRNLRHNFAVLQNAQLVVGRDPAYLDGVQPPFFENPEDFMLAAFLRHQQHALLRLAEHDLVRSHASFTLRHAVEFDFDSDAAAPAHLAG